jgi:hypothetical protein
VQTFGIQREIDSARAWLVELARNPKEPLAQTWTPKLKAVTDELEMCHNQRNDCLRAIEPLQTAVLLLADDVNRELNRLEGDLKKIFAGTPERVSRSWPPRARTARPTRTPRLPRPRRRPSNQTRRRGWPR